MDASPKYSTFLKRYLAFLIDSFIFLPFPILANYFGRSSNTVAFYALTILQVLVLTAYFVVGHGRYGQTLGKYLVGIKLIHTDEVKTIGYGRAFLRESIWFGAQVGGIVFLAANNTIAFEPAALSETLFKSLVGGINTAWMLLELSTMLLHKKRRALHDLLGGSVVVNLAALKRERLEKLQEALPSFQQA